MHQNPYSWVRRAPSALTPCFCHVLLQELEALARHVERAAAVLQAQQGQHGLDGEQGAESFVQACLCRSWAPLSPVLTQRPAERVSLSSGRVCSPFTWQVKHPSCLEFTWFK